MEFCDHSQRSHIFLVLYIEKNITRKKTKIYNGNLKKKTFHFHQSIIL